MTAHAPTPKYATVTEWETFEGEVHGYNDLGDSTAIINALLDRAHCAKWNIDYRPGRTWTVVHADGTLVHGHSTDLRKAKKDAQAALLAASNPEHIVNA